MFEVTAARTRAPAVRLRSVLNLMEVAAPNRALIENRMRYQSAACGDGSGK